MARHILAVLCMLAGVGTASAAELRVYSTPTLKAAIDEILPAFERESGHKLVLRFEGVPVLKREIEAGAGFDVAILVSAAVDDLVKQGKISGVGHAVVARTLTGLAIRAGQPHPKLATVEDVKQALLSFDRLAVSSDSVSGTTFLAMLRRLGIEEQLQPRMVKVTGRSPVSAVGANEADATVITVPNIVGVAGVELGGLLPPELQTPTVFSAGISDGGAAGPGAAFIAFLRRGSTAEVLRRHGLEPGGS